MIKLFFLMPIVTCLIWWAYLTLRGYTLKQGTKGFVHILIFNAVIISFLVLMIFVTDYP
ncbi:hypothetical protein J7384_03610 [Endozoicomonas sp. G2_1]|uniref:hypothetical protein n=1 Tax=Endozoicomonas sp. G2_1 TaxID=2821091 RepID=UPI001ADA69F2|nr:hypothetical protein [Endozoicomonas sp. G2_1]MBO9489442.1 hypothetical protein [Endozoicomonas sp. G2_1]